jgi:transketolase
MTDSWQDEARRVATGIRKRALDVAVRHNGGYLTQACCAAEILATLYVRVMQLGPPVSPPEPPLFPGAPGRAGDKEVWGGGYNGAPRTDTDRFILSPAHYATALYAALIETGRLGPEALEQYSRNGATVEMIGGEHCPGMEVTTGSLGQGLSAGVGQAVARRQLGRKGRIWVLMSDGELQEGQTWEALQVAANFRLDNLAVYLDANRYQVDGPMDRVMNIEPLAPKIAAFGWKAVEVDGHDVDALFQASQAGEEGLALFVICRTELARGIPSLRARPPDKLHFIRFREGEAAAALADLHMVHEATLDEAEEVERV